MRDHDQHGRPGAASSVSRPAGDRRCDHAVLVATSLDALPRSCVVQQPGRAARRRRVASELLHRPRTVRCALGASRRNGRDDRRRPRSAAAPTASTASDVTQLESRSDHRRCSSPGCLSPPLSVSLFCVRSGRLRGIISDLDPGNTDGMNALELTGRARTHIIELDAPRCALHYEAVASFLAMRDAAARRRASTCRRSRASATSTASWCSGTASGAASGRCYDRARRACSTTPALAEPQRVDAILSLVRHSGRQPPPLGLGHRRDRRRRHARGLPGAAGAGGIRAGRRVRRG